MKFNLRLLTTTPFLQGFTGLLIFRTLLILLVLLNHNGFSQHTEDPTSNFHFRGNISANHNGISLIPSFSLGRPAFIFELSMGGERLSFDPEIRFAMDGKPWSFILWWRYKIVKSEKFNLRTGVHPSFVFREITQQSATGTKDIFTVERYFAGELAPSYNVTKKFRIGAYYLHAMGLDPGLLRHTQFFAINASFMQLPLPRQFYFNLNPQIFYLKMGERDGFYTSSALSIGKEEFPFLLNTIVSNVIDTSIPGKSLIWNLGLVYTFNRDYVRKSIY